MPIGADQGATPFVPQERTLPVLGEAVQKCRGCDLYRNATQAVFGELDAGVKACRFAVLLHDYTLKERSEKDIFKLLKRFYFDAALSSPDALPSLMNFADPGHVIFGSDNPYISSDQQAISTHELDQWKGFTANQLQEVNCLNAKTLFPRLK